MYEKIECDFFIYGVISKEISFEYVSLKIILVHVHLINFQIWFFRKRSILQKDSIQRDLFYFFAYIK